MAKAQLELPTLPWSMAALLIALVSLIMLMHNSVMLTTVPVELTVASVLISSAPYLVVAIVARRRPKVLSLGGISGIAGACGLVSMLLWDSVCASPSDYSLFLLTDTFFNIARDWGTVLAALALSRVPRGAHPMIAPLAGIAGAYAVWPLVRSSAEAAPQVIGVIMLGVLLLAGSVYQRDLFAQIRETARPRDLETTNPFSFVPISSKLFACIALFELTFGYATATHFSTIQNWQYALLALAFGVLLLIWSKARRIAFDEDVAFRLSVCTVVIGFLLTPAASIPTAVTSTVIEVGSQCFYALMFSVLASIAARNPTGSLAVVPLGFAVSSASSAIGFTIALLTIDAQQSGSSDALLLSSAAFIVALFCFV